MEQPHQRQVDPAAAGDPDRARRLAVDAEQVARSITASYRLPSEAGLTLTARPVHLMRM